MKNERTNEPTKIEMEKKYSNEHEHHDILKETWNKHRTAMSPYSAIKRTTLSKQDAIKTIKSVILISTIV